MNGTAPFWLEKYLLNLFLLILLDFLELKLLQGLFSQITFSGLKIATFNCNIGHTSFLLRNGRSLCAISVHGATKRVKSNHFSERSRRGC